MKPQTKAGRNDAEPQATALPAAGLSAAHKGSVKPLTSEGRSLLRLGQRNAWPFDYPERILAIEQQAAAAAVERVRAAVEPFRYRSGIDEMNWVIDCDDLEGILDGRNEPDDAE